MNKVFRTMEHGKRHKRVVFLMGGWTYKLFMLRPTAYILSLAGFHCISYCYAVSVFSPDYAKTRHEMLQIKNDILQRVKRLEAHGKTDFYMFGTSLGSVLSVLVANESPVVTKVILNTTGTDMAEAVWTWDVLRPWFKQGLLNNKVTLKQLKREWKPVSIIDNVNNFKGKKVLVYLAEKDVVIPYDHGKELVAKLKADGINPRVIVNKRLRHSLAGYYNLLRPRIYLKFLKD